MAEKISGTYFILFLSKIIILSGEFKDKKYFLFFSRTALISTLLGAFIFLII